MPFDPPTSLPHSPGIPADPKSLERYRLDRIEATIDTFAETLRNQIEALALPEHDELRITSEVVLSVLRHPQAAIATKRRAEGG